MNRFFTKFKMSVDMFLLFIEASMKGSQSVAKTIVSYKHSKTEIVVDMPTVHFMIFLTDFRRPGHVPILPFFTFCSIANAHTLRYLKYLIKHKEIVCLLLKVNMKMNWNSWKYFFCYVHIRQTMHIQLAFYSLSSRWFCKENYFITN